MTTGGRRKIDRIVDPSYLDGLSSAPTGDVRRRLRECEEVEAELSYKRQLIHGKLDILRAELATRSPDGEARGRVVDHLSGALTREGKQRPRRGARPKLQLPARIEMEARRAIDRMVSEAHLARLPDLPDGELEELVIALAGPEAALSDDRKKVLAVIDALQAELVARYKDGRASPGDLLGG